VFIWQWWLERTSLHKRTNLRTITSFLCFCSCQVAYTPQQVWFNRSPFYIVLRSRRICLTNATQCIALHKVADFFRRLPILRAFYDLFASLIRGNRDLSNVEKMHYLKTCVTGKAARLVGNLSISGDNFTIAWNLFIARFENKWFMITAQLDRITSFKLLKTKTAQGLRTLLTTISEATAALRSLGSWLDPESREAWKVNLGSSTSYPTFTQFEKFLIGRTRWKISVLQQPPGHTLPFLWEEPQQDSPLMLLPLYQVLTFLHAFCVESRIIWSDVTAIFQRQLNNARTSL